MVEFFTILFIGAFVAACCVFATFVLIIPIFYAIGAAFMAVASQFQKN